LRYTYNFHVLEVTSRQRYKIILIFKNKKRFFVCDVEFVEYFDHSFGLGSIEREVLNDGERVVGDLSGESRATCEAFHFDVEFEAVVARFGSEDAAATDENWALDIARAGAAGAFLAFEFACAVCYFGTFFAFVSALTLVGEELLAIEINSVFVRLFHSENRIVERDSSAGFATIDVINF